MNNQTETQKTVRTRFAPSPTGFVHIGSLYAALFSFLFARHNNGVHILRIEDTDRTRLVEGALENLLSVMKKVGVEFDEGFYLDNSGALQERGDHGPYLQSQRLEHYQKYADELVAKGGGYYCFCSEQRLEELRAEQVALKKPPMYDRLCRNLSPAERDAKLAEHTSEGRPFVVRQAIPLDGQTIVHDLVYGDISYENRVLDDQVLLKSDGFPTYHLAVVVDDHLMEITHVIRGEEWIPSTPKHILLYQAFGWEPTAYAHLSLILNKDKKKLSKRQGDVAVEDFLRKGYLKEALINFVALLGWNPKTEQEIFSLDELIAQFDIAKINRAGAIFDLDKLDWLNGVYIRSKPINELVEALVPYWIEAGALVQQGTQLKTATLGTEISQKYLEAIVVLERERLKKLSEIGERTKYFFEPADYDAALLVWRKSDAADAKVKLTALKSFFENISDALVTDTAQLETALKAFIAEGGFDTGSVLWPLRVALTGLAASPGPFEVAATLAIGLGKAVIVNRLETAIAKL